MKGTTTFVSNIFYGSNRAFIYIWLSKSEKLVYVGQTNDRLGTWGRGLAHTQLQGTLRARCSERMGVNIDFIEDFNLFSFPLPSIIEFTGEESSFRLAVEYLVQIGLLEKRKDLTPTFRIVSNVMASGRLSNKMVRDIAHEIVADFVDKYNRI